MAAHSHSTLLINRLTDPPPGPRLVLFLPGMSGDTAQWDSLIPRLNGLPADLAYGAPILPLPVFGNKTPTVTQVARGMSNELRNGSQKEVVIVAHSVGAFVALGMARLLPAMVKSVILVNGGLTSVAKFLDHPAREMMTHPRTCLSALRLFVIVGTPTPPALKNAIANSERTSRLLLGDLVSTSALKDPEKRRNLAEGAGSPDIVKGLWKNRHHWTEFTSYAGEVTTPVTFLVGEQDPVSSEQDTAAMAALLPNTRISVLKGAGHAGPLETAASVVSVIQEVVACLDQS